MKRLRHIARTFTFCAILALAGASFTLTGCSLDSLSGADLENATGSDHNRLSDTGSDHNNLSHESGSDHN